MTFFRTERFKKDFRRLPTHVQDRVPAVLRRLISDPRHPAIRLKKMEGADDVWEIRLSDNYRITLQFVKEGVLLRRIGTHNVLRNP